MVSLRSLIVGAALLVAPVIAAATPQQIADGIKLITEKSKALQAPAQSITIVNAPLIAIGQGPFPQIIAGFADIVTTATTLAGQLSDTPPLRKRGVEDDVTLIRSAFHEFVRVEHALLNTLFGKAGVITGVPLVGAPVAAALRSVEAIVDTAANALITLIPSEARGTESEANSLGATFDRTIQAYESLP